jgi:predicted nucleotidyltransferase
LKRREIRLSADLSKKSLGEKRMEQILDLASRFVERYRDHPSVEGVVLFGSQIARTLDKQSDIDLLFVL